MYDIVYKEVLNTTITRMDILAPRVAKKARPGHFIILRITEDSERLPLSVSNYDREKGTVTIIFNAVGSTTMKLAKLEVGDCLADFAGPLGKPTCTDGMKRVAVIGGGMGSTISYPIARELHEMGCHVDSILGFRNKDLIALYDEFCAISDTCTLLTDDGSAGEKGLVTDALRKKIEAGANYDHVVAIGPTIMLKYVSLLTKEFNIPTLVSMSPIMVDGTGMCGGCRITVNGERKFVCVDGPEFDGHSIDYDELLARSGLYKEHERHTREDTCTLFSMKEAD